MTPSRWPVRARRQRSPRNSTTTPSADGSATSAGGPASWRGPWPASASARFSQNTRFVAALRPIMNAPPEPENAWTSTPLTALDARRPAGLPGPGPSALPARPRPAQHRGRSVRRCAMSATVPPPAQVGTARQLRTVVSPESFEHRDAECLRMLKQGALLGIPCSTPSQPGSAGWPPSAGPHPATGPRPLS